MTQRFIIEIIEYSPKMDTDGTMPVVKALMLMLSGGIMVGSILFARQWLANSSLSYRQAVNFTGVGVGVAASMFVYFGIGNGDLFDAIYVGVIIAVAVSVSAWFTFRGRG